MCSASVNFYRGEALMYAERLKQANKRPDVSMMLFKAEIGWNSTDAINNLTSLQSANFEQRAQITIRLMYETSSLPVVNNILSVEVALQNEKGAGHETFTVKLTPHKSWSARDELPRLRNYPHQRPDQPGRPW
jgi:hypothetical protein